MYLWDTNRAPLNLAAIKSFLGLSIAPTLEEFSVNGICGRLGRTTFYTDDFIGSASNESTAKYDKWLTPAFSYRIRELSLSFPTHELGFSPRTGEFNQPKIEKLTSLAKYLENDSTQILLVPGTDMESIVLPRMYASEELLKRIQTKTA